MLSSHVDLDMFEKDEDAVKGHVCYSTTLHEALKHIERECISEELSQYRQFNYCRHPQSANERKHKIKSVLKF